MITDKRMKSPRLGPCTKRWYKNCTRLFSGRCNLQCIAMRGRFSDLTHRCSILVLATFRSAQHRKRHGNDFDFQSRARVSLYLGAGRAAVASVKRQCVEHFKFSINPNGSILQSVVYWMIWHVHEQTNWLMPRKGLSQISIDVRELTGAYSKAFSVTVS